jgi:branched-chain amino acid transport system ATP-binding protein
MSLMRVEHLQKAFGSLVVTRDVSLELKAGERHVIIGPNGAGKTSLIHQLGGQLLPDAGKIFIGEEDVTGLPPEQLAQRGLARTFQKNTLFQGLTVFENARLGAQARFGSTYGMIRAVQARSDLNERAMRALTRLSLAHLAGMRVSSLSYGDQRQLEMAVALAGEPRILLLDEPTSGLSPAETGQLIQLIKQLPAELGIIVIEHDMEVVFSIADRITVLYYGEVLASGAPGDVAADARVREVYLGASSNA